MDEEQLILQMAWYRAFVLTFMHLLIPIVAGHIGLTIAFFRRGEIAAGILCTFCVLCTLTLPFGLIVALAIGWLRAASWGMRAFMALWTGLVFLACLDVVAMVLLRNLDEASRQLLFGGP